MKKLLVLVRHGETDTNKRGKLHSVNDEQELNSVGQNQVTKTAARLVEYKPLTVFSSTELRAVQSAKIISQATGTMAHTASGLEERNWGDYSGKSWPEIQVVLDKLTLDERYDFVPPNGESWREFDSRLQETLTKLLTTCTTPTLVVVTHGGAIRALMPFLLGVAKEESFKHDPANASVTIFTLEDGKFSAQAINDTSHLA